MEVDKKQNTFAKFLSNSKQYPVLAAIAAGLYPLLFYYTNNYTLINSWGHFGYFAAVFILAPIVIFLVAYKVSNLFIFKKVQPYVLPFLNIFIFLFLLKVAIFAGFDVLKSGVVLVTSLLLAFILHKYFKRWIVFQLILAVLGVITLVPKVISQLNYSKVWLQQPDDIETAVFKKKPNIYFIQPDGYVNFSELKKGHYQLENAEFESFLKENNFKTYPNFRSNYASTLTTNSAVFMMKHHYYNKGSNFTEAVNAREVIISENSVLKVLKHNGYKTFFISEQPYFLVNKPKMGYDFSNFSAEEISFVTTGLDIQKEVMPPLESFMEEHPVGPNFFFVEIFNPGHIANRDYNSKGIAGERAHYQESLKEANRMLTLTTNAILERDPGALIVIMADHGGFVGMKAVNESYNKTEDHDLINSIFSTILAIHWPNGKAPDFDVDLKSSVNLFRILTAYLTEDRGYLENLQEDGSYIIIYTGAPQGTYQYLDNNGKVIFKRCYE